MTKNRVHATRKIRSVLQDSWTWAPTRLVECAFAGTRLTYQLHRSCYSCTLSSRHSNVELNFIKKILWNIFIIKKQTVKVTIEGRNHLRLYCWTIISYYNKSLNCYYKNMRLLRWLKYEIVKVNTIEISKVIIIQTREDWRLSISEEDWKNKMLRRAEVSISLYSVSFGSRYIGERIKVREASARRFEPSPDFRITHPSSLNVR